jgi:acyltransferase
MSLDKNRIAWIDRAKALGIFLVYYGHLVEELANKGNALAFTQFKFIYAFHMPLFFILAGFFFKRRYESPLDEIWNRFCSRILPVFTFGLLTLPLWPIYEQATRGRIDWHQLALKAYHYLGGHPDLNTITWFIVCLFTTEVIAIGVLSRVKRSFWGWILAAVFLYFGLRMTLNIRATVTSLGISKNTWYLHEALVAFGLYALGYLVYPTLKKLATRPWPARLLLAVVALGITLLTYDQNRPYQGFAVIMKNSNHGNSAWFVLTAASGTLFVLSLATLLPESKTLRLVGRYTLILVATAGVFHTFINPELVKLLGGFDSGWGLTAISLVLSLLSLVVSLPVAILLDRTLPQLVGRPLASGPWLPALDADLIAKIGQKFKRLPRK